MGNAIAHLTGTNNSNSLDHDSNLYLKGVEITAASINSALIEETDVLAERLNLCRWQFFKLFFHFWYSLEQVSYQAIIGHLEDRRFLILVYGNDHF